MTSRKRSVLITGCSDGGLGAALVVAFQDAGFHVYATARNPAKMKSLEGQNDIETLQLDVQSAESIKNCFDKIEQLDILVNNAGANTPMPVNDLDIDKAKETFDLNVFSQIKVSQVFLPLLVKSRGMIVNQTSLAAATAIPFQSIYNSSKAAMAMVTDTMRLELQPFGVRVIELRTGVIRTSFIQNMKNAQDLRLPTGSIYAPAREVVEKAMRQEGFEGQGMEAASWAKAVVGDLVRKNPPHIIWRGESVWMVWLMSFLPHGTFDRILKRVARLDMVEKIIAIHSGEA
ncbi:MAG: hypothetical protein GOMPHAMPRED_006579 [Gomphillus americanus]|uniref:NAD(P)-binding protein n=1 Tax=Gomphillus americanus TaxID=1940652 RepID=A0A8H3FX65_9LECA|nr:MAG: hypothetical protein GOMPHAMPRED_006579 [Gomphillus americanus]